MNCQVNEIKKSDLTEIKFITKVSVGKISKDVEIKFYVESTTTADLKVMEWITSSCTYVCDKMVFVVGVSNLGPHVAKNVKLAYMIYPFKNLNTSSIILSQGTYTYNSIGGIWNLGELPANKSAIAIFTVIPMRKGCYKALAIVKGDEYDPNLYNNFVLRKKIVTSSLEHDDLLLYFLILLFLCMNRNLR